MQIKINPFATLPKVLALLVEHGADALLAADGIEPLAQFLLSGQLTVWDSERAMYGDAATWDAWDRLIAEHGDRLRQMASAYSARVMAENDLRVAETTITSAGSTGGGWCDEEVQS